MRGLRSKFNDEEWNQLCEYAGFGLVLAAVIILTLGQP
jgi:hypothetical protein